MAHFEGKVICLNITGKGGKHTTEFTVKVDDDKLKEVGEEIVIGYAEILENTLSYPICRPGHRNNDAVNISCLARFFGVDDPQMWVWQINEAVTIIEDSDKSEARKAFERVEPYLDSWDDGSDQIVRDYMI